MKTKQVSLIIVSMLAVGFAYWLGYQRGNQATGLTPKVETLSSPGVAQEKRDASGKPLTPANQHEIEIPPRDPSKSKQATKVFFIVSQFSSW